LGVYCIGCAIQYTPVIIITTMLSVKKRNLIHEIINESQIRERQVEGDKEKE